MVFAGSQMKHTLDMPAVSPPAAIGNGLLSVARRMVTGRNAPALLLFLLGPVAYHRALTPGWLIADWDLLLDVLPYRTYLASAWQHGRWLPLWNPHIYLGAPYLANSLASALYVPNLLVALLPVPAALNWQVALHTGLAGAGMYLYALHGLCLRRTGSAVAGLVYMLGAFMVSHTGQLNQLNAMAWTPWLMLAADRAALEPRPVRLAALAGVVAMVIAAGHTQYAYFSLLLGGIAAAVRLRGIAVRRRRWVRSARTALLLCGGVALGVAMVALQLAATLELVGYSVRSGGLPLAEAGSFSLPFSGFLSDFLPDYTGEHRAEFAGSVGAAVLPLIALALTARWRRPQVGLWALLGLAAVAVAFGPKARVYDLFHALLPGFDLFRVPARALLFTIIAAAVLAGHGTRTVQQMALAWRRPRWRPAILRAASAAIALTGLIILTPLLALLAGNPQHGLFRAFRPVQPENLWLMAGFATIAITIAAAGVLARRSALGLLPLVVLADLVALAGHTYAMNPLPDQLVQTATVTAGLFGGDLNQRYLVLVPANPTRQPASPIPADLNPYDRARYASFLLQFESASPDLSMRVGSLDADGYGGGVLPIRSYVEFRSSLLPPNSPNTPDYTDRALSQRIWDATWLQRAGVGMVITEDGADPNPPGSPTLAPVDRAGWLVAWRPGGARPTRAHMEDGRPALVVSDTGERVVVRLPGGGSGRLVLTDTYYPGWSASVDGQPAEVEQYDGYVRAVRVPSGAREVVFEYHPRWLVPAAAITGGAVLLTVALALLPVAAALRRRAERRLSG
jgi:Bacterial membrane protein YfhO